MRLGAFAAGATALLIAMALGNGPVDAGQKAKKQQWTNHGNVHIGSQISSKHLKSLQRQLKGHQKQAVGQELQHRQLSYEKKSREREATEMGRTLSRIKGGGDHIMSLWAVGAEYGKRGRGHH